MPSDAEELVAVLVSFLSPSAPCRPREQYVRSCMEWSGVEWTWRPFPSKTKPYQRETRSLLRDGESDRDTRERRRVENCMKTEYGVSVLALSKSSWSCPTFVQLRIVN